MPAWAASYATSYMTGILIQAWNFVVEDLFCGRWDEVDKHYKNVRELYDGCAQCRSRMCSYCETACVAPRSWSRVKLQAQQTDASEAQTVATQKHFMLQSAAVHAAVCHGRTCWASTSHTPVSPGRLKPFSRWRAA